jgi:CubicO group peptidase (beta-lactamase class C family)
MKIFKVRILLILFFATAYPVIAQTESHLKKLKNYIDFRAEHSRYSGVTAIYEQDELIFSAVHGFANRSCQKRNNLHTKFDLASATKMFTATGIAILMEENILNPDESIKQYFPEFPLDAAKNISIKQLMQHTTGFSDIFFEDAYLKSDRNRLRELKDYDRFYREIKVGSVPENLISYSNTNYLILGRIIEKISGIDYYSFINQRIFQPLGMDSTGFFEKDEIVSNKAEGYYIDPQAAMEFGVPNDGVLRSNVAVRPVKGMPAGGAFSTVHDMNKFLSALINGKLVKKSTFENLTSNARGGYGLGFQIYEQNDTQVVGHSGGFYGVSTMVFHLPEKNLTFISLANSDFAAQPVFDRFLDILADREIHEPISLPASELEKFGGFFEITEGEMEGRQIEIISANDKLIFDGTLEFYPIGKNRFFDIDNPGFILEFEENITEFIRTDQRGFHQKAVKIDAKEVNVLQAILLPKESLQEYLVEFQFQEDGMMAGHIPEFSIDENALIVDNMMRFLPFEKDKFFLQDDPGMKLHFLRNENNVIIQINVTREKNVVGKLLPADKEKE